MTENRNAGRTTRAAGSRFPDDEHHWITLPADMLCCFVALSDPSFAEPTTHHAANEGRNPPRSQKK